MPTDENANGDGNTPQQPPDQPLPPSIEGNNYGEGEGSESKRHKIKKSKVKPKKHWTKYAEVFVGLCLVCITGYYAFYAHKQAAAMNATLLEIQRQTPEISKSANAAKSASDTAAQTLKEQQANVELDRRPYMVAEGAPTFLQQEILPNVELTANLKFRNIGRTPAAKNLMNYAALTYRPTDLPHLKRFVETAFGDLERKNEAARRNLTSLPPYFEEDLAPNGSSFVTNYPPVVLSSEDFTAYKEHKLVIFYISVDTYSDSFKGNFRTDVCFFHIVADDMKTWHHCDYHNTIK